MKLLGGLAETKAPGSRFEGPEGIQGWQAIGHKHLSDEILLQGAQ
jgi:hypothetical protein